MKNLFLLNPEITFLNHGSFGACPKPIFENYQYWQKRLEESPVQFITKEGPIELEKSRAALASYIHCDKDDLVYMPNPSTAMNTVIRSLDLKEGDEILSTNQEYGAMDKTWKYYCQKTGAIYKKQHITLPLTLKEVFLEEFWKGLTMRTKVIFLSQITSQTALIFPVEEICKKAKELGLITLIDGAHVPGHIPLNLNEMDPDVYTGACHKWMLAPKGNSFLYVKKSFQEKIDPLIVSWGYDTDPIGASTFIDYHEFNGTRDFSAYLTTPIAIQFLNDHNWEAKKLKCRTLLKAYYPVLAELLNSHVLSPLTDEFLGQICSIPIQTLDPNQLKNMLYDAYKIEIPIMVFPEATYLRVSFQAYNDQKEIETLINAIKSIKQKTNLLG